MSDDAALRAELRKFHRAFGLVKSKAARRRTAFTPSTMTFRSR